MRAIIRITFDTSTVTQPRRALEDFLRLEGFNVVDLEADKKWLNDSRRILLRDKITSFIDSMAEHEEKGLKMMDYIFSNNGTEGIVTSRNHNELTIIVYKHNLEKLKTVCMALTESLVSYFNRFQRRSAFSITNYTEHATISDIDIREDNRQDNIMTGKIITSRRGKRRRIHREKRFEYTLGRVLVVLTLLVLALSLYANYKYGFKTEELNNQMEYWVKFAERVASPLIVTSSVLWFNLWSHSIKIMSNKIVIEWK